MDIPCICPPKADEVRHPAGDTITLRERLDFRAALAARNAIALAQGEGEDTAGILAALTETYLILGIESWSVVDAKGKAVPVNRQTITEYLLSNIDVAMDVADAADDLYREAVVGPLLARASTSSPDTQTPDSTSATNGSGPKPPKPSKRSSTTTTQTADIAATT